jgi:hypothetical protein
MSSKLSKQVLQVFSIIFKAGIAVLLAFSIVNREVTWIIWGSVSLWICLIPFLLHRYAHLSLPYMFDALISAALLLHMINGVLCACTYLGWYDKITHLVSSMLIAMLTLITIFIADRQWDGITLHPFATAFAVIVCTMTLGVIWEFLEWLSDYLVGTHTQLGLNDTIGDLFVDGIGGLIIGLLSIHLIKKGTLERMTQEFGQQLSTFLKKRGKS